MQTIAAWSKMSITEGLVFEQPAFEYEPLVERKLDMPEHRDWVPDNKDGVPLVASEAQPPAREN